MQPLSHEVDEHRVPQALREALALLLDARELARKHQVDRWDFALRIDRLSATGLTDNDLRTLTCDKVVQHADEIFQDDNAGRSFKEIGPLAFTERTCFVLTDLGVAVTQELGMTSQANRSLILMGANLEAIDLHRLATPHYDSRQRELWLGDRLLLRFRKASHCQETILISFEEVHWRQPMDDPLPGVSNQDPKCRLRQTITNLNRHIRPPVLRFTVTKSGTAVGWEPGAG